MTSDGNVRWPIIKSAAERLINEYGDGARMVAEHRELSSRQAGEQPEAQLWHSVANEIGHILKTKRY